MEASIGALLQAWNKDPDLCLSRAGNAARGCRNLRREFAGNIECRQLPVGGGDREHWDEVQANEMDLF
jgi:hypothetical protein